MRNNIRFIDGIQEGENNYQEKSNLILNVVVRKCIFKPDEITGIAVVEENQYVMLARSSLENENTYRMFFYEEGKDFFDDLIIDMSKEFDVCTFYDKKLGSYSFVAPADNAKEAGEIYRKFIDF